MALALWSCGYIGIELRELDGRVDDPGAGDGAASLEDGGPDAAQRPDDASPHDLADADADAEVSVLDADAGFADADAPDAATPGPTDAGSDPDGGVDAASPVPCDFSGNWAARVDISLSWSAGVVAAGTGTARIWFAYRVDRQGTAASLVVCGLTVPDVALNPAVGNELYRPLFPNTLFDAVPARVVATGPTVTVAGTRGVGSPFTFQPAGFLLGTTLANPVSSSWPATASLVLNDTDLDGQPGATIDYLSDATHVYPRINPTGTQRSDHGFIAMRVAFGANGVVTSCGSLSGPATMPRYDTHIVGCSVAGGGVCTAAQRDMLDPSAPVYSAGTSSFRAIRVADAASCAAVRSALP